MFASERRIKFIWGASKVIRGRWYLGLVGLYDRNKRVRGNGIAISVRGLLAWSGLFSVLLWWALATGLFWISQKNPYSLLTYSDTLLYPLRRASIAEKKGRAFLDQGQALARAGQWAEAANLIRQGLARVPNDRRTRQTLAYFYRMTNQYPLAVRTLFEGLHEGYPGRAYLDNLFRLAIQGEDFEAIAAACSKYLPTVKRLKRAEEHRWLLEQRHAALTAAARHQEALQHAEAEELGDGARERKVLALVELGRTDEALAALREWRKQPKAVLARIACLEAHAFRKAGRFDEMEAALRKLRQLEPAVPDTFVFAVVQEALAGRERAAAATLEEYLFRFGGFPQNLKKITSVLITEGKLALVERCVAAAAERGFLTGEMRTQYIELLLQEGEWAVARREYDSLPPIVEGDQFGTLWRNWARAVLDAAQQHGDAGRRKLVEIIRSRPWPVGIYRLSTVAMIRASHPETARTIVDFGLGAFPTSLRLRQAQKEVAQMELSPPRRESSGGSP